MRQDTRDLAHSGLYLCCLALLVGSVAFAGAAVVSDASDSPLFNWTSPVERAEIPEATHISRSVANAREIRAALARPIPKPEALSPITAKLAYGHLRPGAANAMARAHPSQDRALPAKETAETPAASYRASSAVTPELHKVY